MGSSLSLKMCFWPTYSMSTTWPSFPQFPWIYHFLYMELSPGVSIQLPLTALSQTLHTEVGMRPPLNFIFTKQTSSFYTYFVSVSFVPPVNLWLQLLHILAALLWIAQIEDWIRARNLIVLARSGLEKTYILGWLVLCQYHASYTQFERLGYNWKCHHHMVCGQISSTKF